MKIQLLNGGLANQAFQYIFARYYELSHPGRIMYLDDSFFDLVKAHNGYELKKVFGLKPHFLKECFDEDVWRFILEERKQKKSIPRILYENGMNIEVISEIGWENEGDSPFYRKVKCISANSYEPYILESVGNTYYNGYWINKEWFETFKEVFWNEFTFPQIIDEKNMGYQTKILESKSVSIHIRRGDYVDIGMAGTLLDYKMRIEMFEKMIEMYPRGIDFEIEKNIQEWSVFVFSDDILWCKNNAKEMGLCGFKEIIFVEGNMDGNNYKDLYLMSLCEGMIMSNSAFCFLAVLLNRRKRVIVNSTARKI